MGDASAALASASKKNEQGGNDVNKLLQLLTFAPWQEQWPSMWEKKESELRSLMNFK